MRQWYVMDMFRQVYGPYDLKEVERRVKKGSALFVARQGMKGWLTPEMVPELQHPGSAPAKGGSGAEQAERGVWELLGICKGMIADGVVNAREAAYLKSWVDANPETAGIWPANVLHRRMNRIFEDGMVDATEQEELAELLRQLTGEKPSVAEAEQKATRIEFDHPEPSIDFHGQQFCLAGRFAHGTRAFCEKGIVARGGQCQAKPDDETDYLVVGSLALDPGDKDAPFAFIQQVMDAKRTRGVETAIVSEETWSGYLT